MRLRDSLIETAKHFFVYSAGLAISKLGAFILIPVYTRSFSVEEYGVFTVLTIVLACISTAAQLGINSAVLRSYFDYDSNKERSRMFGTAFMLLGASTTAFLFFMWLFSKGLSQILTGSESSAICFVLLGFTLVTDSLFTLFTTQLRAEKRSFAFSVWNVVKLFTTCIAAILLVVVLKRGITGAVAANAASSFLTCVGVLPLIVKRSSFHFDAFEAKKLLAFGIPLIPMSLSSIALASVDRFFLLHMSGSLAAGKAIVGVYSLIYTYAGLFRIGVADPLLMLWIPQMMSVRESKMANEFYSRTFSIYVIFSGFIVIAMTVAYSRIVLLMSGARYLGSPLVVWLILLSLVFIGSTRLLGVGLTFARKTGYSALFFAIAALINVGLNFYMIPRYHMLGAAITAVVGAIILPFCYYFAGEKYYKVQYQWLLIVKCVSLFLILSAAYFSLPRLGLSDSQKLAVELTILILYPILVIALRIVRLSELKAILSSKSKVDTVENEPAEEKIGADIP